MDRIQTYRAPKDPPEGTAGPATDRMWGAIVPKGEQAWFFKVTGAKDVVAEKIGELETFLKSVRFAAADAPPKWTLPEGWKEEAAAPGSMRYSTIRIPTDEAPLELSVTTLPWDPADETQGVLSNVNRWRGQMSLGPIGARQLERETTELPLEDATAIVVNLEGRATAGMGQPPFASAMPPPVASRDPQAADQLKYSVPEGWAKGAVNQFRKAAFVAVDGSKKVEITVSTAGGDLLANVNRWRGQIGLAPISADELKEQTTKIPVGELTGDYVELVGSQGQSILAVVVPGTNEKWFIKLQGDSDLASREKPKFEAFVKSMQIGK